MSIEDEAPFTKKMDGADKKEDAEPLPLSKYYGSAYSFEIVRKKWV